MHPSDAWHFALIGALATVVLDAWVLLLNRLGVATLPIGLIGRWIGHIGRGRMTHFAIRQAAPIRHEIALGWVVHYATGMAFAMALGVMVGGAWLQSPTIAPALLTGTVSAAMPLFIMQPAMGAGFASSKTATPAKNVLRSVANHLVLGFGFYIAAVVIRAIAI